MSWVEITLEPGNALGLSWEEAYEFQIFASVAIDLVWLNRNLAVHWKPFDDPILQARKV